MTDDLETEGLPLSQDFPDFHQTQGRDTILTCSFCSFTTRDRQQLHGHKNQEHPKCDICHLQVEDNESLTNHKITHETTNCTVCGKNVESGDIQKHKNMHEKYELFGKELEKGKVKANKKPSKLTGYNIFIKESYANLAREERNLSSADIMRNLGNQWKQMSKTDKKAYNDLADEKNKTSSEVNSQIDQQDRTFTCPWCDKKFPTKTECKAHLLRDHVTGPDSNALNSVVPDVNQDTLKKCEICHILMRQSALAEHKKSHENNDEITLEEEICEDTVEEGTADGVYEDTGEGEGADIQESTSSVVPKVRLLTYHSLLSQLLSHVSR